MMHRLQTLTLLLLTLLSSVVYATETLPAELTLADAQRLALAGNPSLAAARKRVDAAEARVLQARSTYWPQAGLSASSSKTWLSDTAVNDIPAVPGVVGISVNDTVETHTVGVSAQYLLFDGFNRKYTHEAAKFGAGETEAAYDEARRLLLDAVAQSFYNVQLARENITIANANVDFNARQLKEAQARRRVGTGSLSDELNFEVRIREAQTAVISAERELEVARIGLASLMALHESEWPASTKVAPLLKSDLSHSAEDLDPAALVTYAMDYRPDLHQVRLTLKRSEAEVGRQKSNFFPKVSASAGYEATNDKWEFGRDEVGSFVGVTLDLPLFTGGRNKAQLEEARANRSSQERLVERVELDVAAEVRQVLRTLQSAERQLRLQEATTQYVERNRDLVEKEYRGGKGSLVRLNEAQRDLIAARGRLALAQVGYLSLQHSLRTATAETISNSEPTRPETEK